MLAEGDVCPISRKAMEDIMPAFQPKSRKGKEVSLIIYGCNSFSLTCLLSGSDQPSEQCKCQVLAEIYCNLL